MLVTRLMAAACAAVVLVFVPGCVTLFSKTEVVREGEARRPVTFESQQAAETFHTALKKQHPSLGSAYLGVPFVTLYSRDRVLSETARFNDAVARCDTNQDGVITEVEATVFANHAD
jgi:hypothetical protein